MTWHIDAKIGDIAESILLPGDPLRAKYIAENFLEKPKLYSSVRNILGYTGYYKGEKISVQGTGMGMPSMAIYSTELVRDFGVKKMVRVGTCGGLHKELHVRDIVMAQASTTDSSMPRNIFGGSINFAPIADINLLEKAMSIARTLKLPFHVGNVFCQDRLYDDEIDFEKLISYGIIAVEMEAAALYLTAAKYKVQALCICTVSNNLITGEDTTVQEKESSFDSMAELALETVIR